MEIPIEPRTLSLLVATLFFFISLLINLLQRRYSRTRLDYMLEKDESVVNLLGVIDKYLGKLERTYTFDLHRASSPQEVGKAIYVARNKIQSTAAAMEEHLQSLRHPQRKIKKQQKQMRRLTRTLPKPAGRRVTKQRI